MYKDKQTKTYLHRQSYYVSNLKREENSGQNFGASVYKDKQKKTFTQAVMKHIMSVLLPGAI
jgi:hypothetical protein